MVGIDNNIRIDSKMWDLMKEENQIMKDKTILLKKRILLNDEMQNCDAKLVLNKEEQKIREQYLLSNNLPIIFPKS
jgi:hypothetical protein